MDDVYAKVVSRGFKHLIVFYPFQVIESLVLLHKCNCQLTWSIDFVQILIDFEKVYTLPNTRVEEHTQHSSLLDREVHQIKPRTVSK